MKKVKCENNFECIFKKSVKISVKEPGGFWRYDGQRDVDVYCYYEYPNKEFSKKHTIVGVFVNYPKTRIKLRWSLGKELSIDAMLCICRFITRTKYFNFNLANKLLRGNDFSLVTYDYRFRDDIPF